MTANQINYQRMRTERAQLDESQRHNKETERVADLTHKETARSNVVRERETERHNRATEEQNLLSYTETARHNLATEDISRGNLAETVRHNKAGETETNRHNVAQEKETSRHNVASESLGWAQHNETVAHNTKTELQRGMEIQYNALHQAESRRIEEEFNDDRLVLWRDQTDKGHLLSLYSLDETTRHNKANETIGYWNIGSNYLRSLGGVASALVD